MRHPAQTPTPSTAAFARAMMLRLLMVIGLLLLGVATLWSHYLDPPTPTALQSGVIAPSRPTMDSKLPIAPTVRSTPSFSSLQDPTSVLTTATRASTSTSPAAPSTHTPIVATATAAAVSPIVRLVIPSIGVDAAVEVTSVDAGGVMQPPQSPLNVGWYDFSAQPGQTGNAVFAGHVDYAGLGPAVFWHLGELQAGDMVEIHQQDGTLTRYAVMTVQSYAAAADAREILASTGTPTIMLITCGGSFDSAARQYDQRLVVSGALVVAER